MTVLPPHDRAPHDRGDGLAPAEIEQPSPRAASLRLRGEAGDESRSASLLATANQSLADALRLTFRLLILGVIALAVIYVVSGLQRIPQGFRGIGLAFGRPYATDLEPGLRVAPPSPFGEIVRVDISPQAAFSLPGEEGQLVRGRNLEREFIPNIPRGEEDKSFGEFPVRQSLNPEADDSLITADLNIVHGRWRLTYERSEPYAYAASVHPEMEGSLLRSVVRRAIIEAVGETRLEEYLKPTLGSQELPERAQRLANERLAALGSGLAVTSLRLEERMPPRSLKEDFESVQAAEAEKRQAIRSAEKDRDTTLLREAGPRWGVIVNEIDRYEAQIDAGDPGAAGTLARIFAIMQGEPVELDGTLLVDAIGGEVASLISSAGADASGRVRRARSDYERFSAGLEQYRANPGLMLMRSWGDMYQKIAEYPLLDVVRVQSGLEVLELTINRDQDNVEGQLQAINQRRAEEADRRRQRAAMEAEGDLRSTQPVER